MMIGRLGGGGVSVVVDGEDGAEVGHVGDGGSFDDFSLLLSISRPQNHINCDELMRLLNTSKQFLY